jgi:predicted membrane-bound spermidine synthase
MTSLEMPTMSASTATFPTRVRLLCVLFFFSGFPALIYQLTWQRSLFRIFGVNTESVTIVVTAFMLGLGLGSLVGGWISRRRNVGALVLLGVIELLTAAFGLVSLAVFDQVGHLVSDLPLVVLAAINLLLVLVPTLLMGATLPILVSYLVKTSGQIGSAVGTLYFVNTLGAGAACLVCAAIIFPFLGMHAAVWIGAGINVVVGIGALLSHYVNRDSTATDMPRAVTAKPATHPVLGMRFVALLALLGGFVSLSYEIFLFRTISFATGSSSMAFALTLGSFLVGIAGGARVAAEACDRLSPADAMRKAATDLIWGNFFGALFLPLMAHFAWIGSGVVGLGIAVVYLIARQWGALLPYLSQFGISVDREAGMQTALLYFANIAGCASGAVLTGFFLTNWLGLLPMAVFLLAGGTLCAVLLIGALPATVSERAWRGGIAFAVLLAGAVAIPVLGHRVFENLQNKGASDHDFAHIVENRSGIITVDTDGTVFGNGMYDGRFNTNLKTDRNGIIRPYALSLFHPAPRDVLMIGLSSGSWAQVIANNPAVASLTVVEINRGYLELIEQQPEVSSILSNPKVRIIEDDGRRWLGHHPEMRFDAIVANTTFNYRANATNLLSTEYLDLVKQHLAPGGVYFYNTTDSRRVQRTACAAFPHGARFHNHMVVSEIPIDWDFARWRDVIENYKIDGKPEFDLNNAADRSRIDSLMDEYRRGGPMIEECPELLSATTGSALITDDNMGTEWRHYLHLE